MRIAFPATVLMTASPHFAVPVRRVGQWAIAVAAIAVAMVDATSPLGSLAGVLIAVAAAAVVHLVFGSSAGRPSLGLVHDALDDLGVSITELGAADRQPAGYFLVDARDADGNLLAVKVYGRDAHDAALVGTVWRTVWYREPDSPLRFGRLQQVEHEAFLTLFAGQQQVTPNVVVTAGSTADDDAVLVLRRNGHHLVDAPPEPDELDAIAAGVWDLVGRLGRAGMAHGQVDLQHLVMHEGRLGLHDFRGATMSPTETQRRSDQVQAFVTTALLAGPDSAIAAATDALGTDGLRKILPYLQPPALTPSQRREVRADDLDLDDLRKRAASAVGADAPELIELRRISLGTIIKVVLPAIAIVLLISGIAGLDLEELKSSVRNANWWLVALGFVVGQLPRFAQACSTLGAAPIPLPLGPVYALQLSTSYINLAVPTTAGRVALNIRFFQRHGVPPGGAIAAGALDSFCGFLVQMMILGTLLLFTPASLDLDVGDSLSSAGRFLLIALVIVGAAVTILLAVKRLRQFVVRWAKQLFTEAVNALRGLRSPRRLLLLFAGNTASEILFSTALGVFVAAMGYRLTLGQLLLVSISISLFSGLMPIPGGIGVAEAGLTWGLVQSGVPEEAAFAAVILYRLATFYLPPIWGYVAFTWLQKNQHL